MMRNAQEIAEWIAQGGRESYALDHEVEPAMFFVAETGTLVLNPHPSYWRRLDHGANHPTDVYADIIFRTGGMYPWRYIGTCSEAWVQHMTPTPDELAGGPIDPVHDLPRGRLESLHEQGDASVRTCVVVFVLDLDNRFTSHIIASVVENERPLSWHIDSVDVADGHIEGAMSELMMSAWEQRRVFPDDLPQPPMPMIAELLVQAEVASACMVVDP